MVAPVKRARVLLNPRIYAGAAILAMLSLVAVDKIGGESAAEPLGILAFALLVVATVLPPQR